MESFALNEISGVTHGFGTLHEPILPFARTHWHARPLKTQVHGVNIAIATENCQQVGAADGWYTQKRNTLLTLVNADCYPVLFHVRMAQPSQRCMLAGVAHLMVLFII